MEFDLLCNPIISAIKYQRRKKSEVEPTFLAITILSFNPEILDKVSQIARDANCLIDLWLAPHLTGALQSFRKIRRVNRVFIAYS